MYDTPSLPVMYDNPKMSHYISNNVKYIKG